MRVVFLVLSLVTVGFAASMRDAGSSRSQRSNVMKMLSMDGSDLVYCERNSDCEHDLQAPVCDMTMRLCKPRQASGIQKIDGACSTSNDCSPLYVCHQSKCHFSGPKACDSKADCLKGVKNLRYQCKEESVSAPGNRCWSECEKDRDCYECEGNKCRIDRELQPLVGCCQGFCQKKIACDANSGTSEEMNSGMGRAKWHSHPLGSMEEN